MESKGFTSSLREYNEDTYAIGDGWVAVLDGATDLGKKSEFNAHWFVNAVVKELKNELSNVDKSLGDCLSSAVTIVRKQAPEGFNGASASVLLLRQVEKTVEFYSVGDCTGVVYFKDNTSKSLYNSALSVLDQISIDLTVKVSKDNQISMAEALKSQMVQDKLIEHRNRKNTPNGYYTCDLSGEGIPFGDTHIFPVEQLSDFLLMSDGFADIVDKFAMYENFDVVRSRIEDIGLQETACEYFQFIKTDPDWVKYPRLKYSDDTTVVMVTFR